MSVSHPNPIKKDVLLVGVKDSKHRRQPDACEWCVHPWHYLGQLRVLYQMSASGVFVSGITWGSSGSCMPGKCLLILWSQVFPSRAVPT